MELPPTVDPLPTPPDFCFNSTQHGNFKLESGSTVTTLDKGDTASLIKSACDDMKDGLVEEHHETSKANPNTRIVAVSWQESLKGVKVSKQQCNDHFTQLLNDCK